MTVRFIHDVHGKYDKYYNIAKESKYSLQLGDFGFSQSWNSLYYSDLDPNNHKILGGNHDDMQTAPNSDHWLGDYGEINFDNTDIFFIRGGLSIDRTYRVGEWMSFREGPKTWWSAEELNFNQMMGALDLYKQIKPKVMISHVAPKSIKDMIVGKNDKPNILTNYGFDLGFEENTTLLLQECLNYHTPCLWAFAHYHKHFDEIINRCRFICGPELKYIDIDISNY